MKVAVKKKLIVLANRLFIVAIHRPCRSLPGNDCVGSGGVGVVRGVGGGVSRSTIGRLLNRSDQRQYITIK